MLIRKDNKQWKDVNTRMKSFYEKKDIGLIDNFILQEHHLRTKKLYLSKRGNGVFAKLILHFIES